MNNENTNIINEEVQNTGFFTDRQVENPHRFTVKKLGADGVVTEEFTADIERMPSSVINAGTAINAQNLNAALSEKQDVLTAGEGISIENNVISLKNEIASIGYENIAQSLLPTFSASVDKSAWTARPLTTDIQYGKPYYYDVENNAINYSDAAIEFEVSDIIYDSTIDADPTISVKFDCGSNLVCLFRFFKNGVIIRNGTTWSAYGSRSVNFAKNDAGKYLPFRAKVCRRKLDDGSFNYTMFINDMLCINQNVPDSFDHAAVCIGTIGCKATLKYWKADGTF